MGRYFRRGKTKIYFVTTIAAFPALTHTEVIAGEDITKQVATVNGFSFTNNPIDTPDMDTAFTKKIGGEDQSADSSLEMYELDDDTDIYDLLEKGTSGFMVFFPAGLAGATPAASDVADIWPVDINSRVRTYATDNSAAKYNVAMSATEVPAFDVVLT